jgi:hypothetical protein
MRPRWISCALLLIAMATLAGNPKVYIFEAKGPRGWIKFWGNAEVELEGRGSLVIKNLSYMNVKNEGKWGEEKSLADGVQYSHFEGKVKIIGRGIHVELRGWDLSIVAKGQGEAHLQGEGTYSLNDEKGEWDKRVAQNKFKKLHFRS